MSALVEGSVDDLNTYRPKETYFNPYTQNGGYVDKHRLFKYGKVKY